MPYVRAGRQRPWSLKEGLLLADRFILDRPAVESVRCATWHAYDRSTGGHVALKVFDRRFDAGLIEPVRRSDLDGPGWWRPQVPIEDLCTELPGIAAALSDRGVGFHGSYRHRSLALFAWDWHTQTSIWSQPVGPSVTGIKDLVGIGLHVSVALADLHALKLCHGNVKPTSFIVGGNGKILLGDHLGGRARQPSSLDLRPPSKSDTETLVLDAGYDLYTLVTSLIRLAGVDWDAGAPREWPSIIRDFRARVNRQLPTDVAGRAAGALDPVLHVFGQVLDAEQVSPSAAELEKVLGTALARIPAPELAIAVAPADRHAMSALIGPGRKPLSTGTFICVDRPPVLPEDAARAFEDESLYEQPPLEVVDVLGWGGFALVYRCFWHNIGRMVAAKELYPRSVRRTKDGSLVADDPDSFDRLRTSCYAWEGLNCAALTGNEAFVDFYERESGESRFPVFPADPPATIVPTLWALPSHGTVIVITELAPGTPLLKVVSESGPVDAGTAVQVLSTMLENLSWLRDFGVVHQDCSPSNVVVDPVWGDAYLLDFGLAGRAEADSEVSQGDLVGLGRLIDFARGGPERPTGTGPRREQRLDELVSTMRHAGLGDEPSIHEIREAVDALVEEFADHWLFGERARAREAGSLCGGWRRYPGLGSSGRPEESGA